MSTINKISKKDTPELWKLAYNLITDDEAVYEEKTHRKHSTFFCESVYELEESSRNFKGDMSDETFNQLLGFWKTNLYIWNDSWPSDDIYTLERCKKIETEKTIIEISYVPIN